MGTVNKFQLMKCLNSRRGKALRKACLCNGMGARGRALSPEDLNTTSSLRSVDGVVIVSGD